MSRNGVALGGHFFGCSRLPYPSCCFHMLVIERASKSPGQGLPQSPEPGALAVQPQRRCQFIQTMDDVNTAVAELIAANNWRQRKLSFAGQRFRVDDQPRLARGSQDVVSM